ncbi:MAG TPA: nicotinamide-nucleotide amidohydrolase family protein [Chloroflexota bacterium]|nr:nicotinamide-nucleotide amidohydrolase family protein [Chloroflexota bacterium]
MPTPRLATIAGALRERGLTVAVAESASGGLVAAELTRLPGSSSWFRGGLVAYDERSKVHLLGISAELLASHGSVSAEACLALARAARTVFQADIGLGETSISGPGGATEAKPIGLSFAAIATATSSDVRTSCFSGGRQANRRAAVAAVLDLLATETCRFCVSML